MMETIHRYGVYETSWQWNLDGSNPLWDVDAVAEFTGPSGQVFTIHPFWDGGNIWRLRFSPDETGEWSYQVRGTDGIGGRFACVPYEGDNPLYRHGPLQLSTSRRHLEHRDGAPFFWLGDTVWNGVIRSDDANWEAFLTTRATQRFSVIQFVCSHWRGDALDEAGEPSCTETHPIEINPAFFQRIDRRVAMVNQHGLVGAPVALWSLLETDIGYKLPEADAIKLASYIVSRYDAYQVVWLLGGDGNYQKMGIDRWRNIGKAVFSMGHDRLVTLHPCGQNWIGEEFRDEDWYDIIGYQSGHGDAEKDICWLTSGPPTANWNHSPALPVINLEPNYETAFGYSNKTEFTDYYVRRAAYWSLLGSPTAGLTYGHDAIWNWNFETGPSEGHGTWHNSQVPPWHTGLDTPGIRNMTVLRNIFDELPWTELLPAPDVLAVQPGTADPERHVAVATGLNGLLVLYSPCGGLIDLAKPLPRPCSISLIDPATGVPHELACKTSGTEIALPDGTDWLVIYRP